MINVYAGFDHFQVKRNIQLKIIKIVKYLEDVGDEWIILQFLTQLVKYLRYTQLVE